MQRCAWVPAGDALYEKYHDEEWGVPVHNDRTMFEFLVLESAQAGLSWRTILGRRAGYKKAFANFDAKKVAKFTDIDVERLMQDAGIIRNRAKIVSTISNAKVFLEIGKEFGTFCNYIWQFVEGETVEGHLALAKDLKKRGFKFFGPTIAYAHMQAVGMVNDHAIDCFRYGK